MFVCATAKVKSYDYYGAYETRKNVNYKYKELLGKEYTFDFPPHHDVVRYTFIVLFLNIWTSTFCLP